MPRPGPSVYVEQARQRRLQATHPVIYAQGEALGHAATVCPYLITPNRYELERLAKRPLSELTNVTRATFKQQNGSNDALLLVDSDHSYHSQAPAVQERSTVGADAPMIAGLITTLARGE